MAGMECGRKRQALHLASLLLFSGVTILEADIPASVFADVETLFTRENGFPLSSWAADAQSIWQQLEGCWKGEFSFSGGPCTDSNSSKNEWRVCCADTKQTADIQYHFTRSPSLQAAALITRINGTRLQLQQSGLTIDFYGGSASRQATFEILTALPILEMMPVNGIFGYQMACCYCVSSRFVNGGSDLVTVEQQQWFRSLKSGIPREVLFKNYRCSPPTSWTVGGCTPSTSWGAPSSGASGTFSHMSSVQRVDASECTGWDYSHVNHPDDHDMIAWVKPTAVTTSTITSTTISTITSTIVNDTADTATTPQSLQILAASEGTTREIVESGSTIIIVLAITLFMMLVIVFVYIGRRCGLLRARDSSTTDSIVWDSSQDEEQPSNKEVAKKAEQPVEEASSQRHEGPSSEGATTKSTLATEQVFKEMMLQDIVCTGIAEHWIIANEDLELNFKAVAKGGFGEVLQGRLFGVTDVAVKRPRGDQNLVSNSEAQALANEMRLFRMIRHPNIVFFHGVTAYKEGDSPKLCLVLEWVSGSDLGRYAQKRRSTDTMGEELRNSSCHMCFEHKLLIDVCKGMQFLHVQEPAILHRDLKPANVLVETIAQPPRAKIADFGLSVHMIGRGPSARAGTRGYMAPEVADSQLYDIAADVYSFGCVCLYVLSGHHPHATSSHARLETCRSYFGRDDPMVLVARAATQCLTDDPQSRPSFQEVCTELQRTDKTSSTCTSTALSGINSGNPSTPQLVSTPSNFTPA